MDEMPVLDCLLGDGGLDDVVVGLQVRQYNYSNRTALRHTSRRIMAEEGGGGSGDDG